MEKQKLLFHQTRLSDRGVAEMVLLHISASKGVPSEMVMKTLELGIAILRGGNIDIQMGMLNHLKEKKDVGFFTSIAGLMNSCSVLDLDAFERNTKAEGKTTSCSAWCSSWICFSSSHQNFEIHAILCLFLYFHYCFFGPPPVFDPLLSCTSCVVVL